MLSLWDEIKAEGSPLLMLVREDRPLTCPSHRQYTSRRSNPGTFTCPPIARRIALATEISIVTSGAKANLNTSTGDKSSAYFRSSLRNTPPPRPALNC